MSNSRRQVDEGSDAEDDVPIVEDTARFQARNDQAEIMMKDLSSITRDHITSTDKGPNARPANQRYIHHMRACNQEGTDEAEQATRDREDLNKWSNFHSTQGAQTGEELLADLDGGQAHRISTRQSLQSNGPNLTLEDTYFEGHRSRRPNGVPPPYHNHAGTSNGPSSRGSFGRGRGGGAVGRDSARGGSSRGATPAGRPLDPAVDPDREYGYKDKRRNNQQPRMVDHVGRSKSDQQSRALRKRRGSQLSTQQTLHERPNGVLQQADMNFMERILKGWKLNNQVQQQPVGPSQSPVASTRAEDDQPILPAQTDHSLLQPIPNESIQQINRSELIPATKSPGAFTDGQLTRSSLSGFSPSIDGDGSNTTVVNNDSVRGLGIQGVAMSSVSKTAQPDLMDIDIPALKKAELTPPLQISPRDDTIPIPRSEWLAYQMWKQSQDETPPSPTTGAVTIAEPEALSQQSVIIEKPVISTSSDHAIGPTQRASIVGDRQTLMATVKSTQTTPGLTQSKWASNKATPLEIRVRASLPNPSPVEPAISESPKIGQISSTPPDEPQGFESANAEIFDAQLAPAAPVVQESEEAMPVFRTNPSAMIRARLAQTDDGSKLHSEMQQITKTMAETRVSAKESVVPSDNSSDGPKTARNSTQHIISSEVKKSGDQTQSEATAAGPTISFPMPKNRSNPFDPRDSDAVVREQLASYDAPTIEVSGVTVEDLEGDYVANKVPSQKSLSSAKESTITTVKRSVGDSKWATTKPGVRATKGISKWAAAEPVDTGSTQASPLRSMPVNHAKLPTGPFGGSSALRSSARTDPTNSENSPLKPASSSILGDSKNLMQSTSTFAPAKQQPVRSQKFKKPINSGLALILAQQEEERELDPDEVKNIANGTYREVTEARAVLQDAANIISRNK